MSTYPEHDRLAKVHDDSQKIGEFLEWLTDVKGVHLSADLDNGTRLTFPINKLLAEYFEIDLDKIIQEKEAMLVVLREANQEARA